MTRDIVGIDVAEGELAAVRDLLAALHRDVSAEEVAAAEAEARAASAGSSLEAGITAVERSRRIIEEMTAVRRSTWSASYDHARREAEVRVAEASAEAARLTAAARREVDETTVLRAARAAEPGPAGPRFPAPAPTSPTSPTSPASPTATGSSPIAPARPPASAYPPVYRPGYDPSLAPAPRPVAPPAVPVARPAFPDAPPATAAPTPLGDRGRTPTLPDHDDHAAFWREEQAASQSRVARAGSIAPVEALLPLLALVIVLAAVLLLIG